MYDGRGSVVGVVDNANEFVSYSYTAYGELMPDSPTPGVFGYNGEQTDFSIGIQYLRARYYDATINRFIQEDNYRGSFSEPQTINRYIYVGCNPANRIDPSGYGWLKNTWNTVKSAASQAVSAISNAVKSLVTVKNTVTDTIKNISSKIAGKDSKLNQIENITNNSLGDSNQIEDTTNDGDSYGSNNGNYPNNRVPNPNTGDNSDIGECIVVSGGHYEGVERYKYLFIETALREISDRNSSGVENIVWIIDGSDYSEKDIKNFQKDGYANGANKVVIIDVEAEFKNYIETMSTDRSGQRDMPITQFYVYSHGLPGQIVLERNKEEDISDIITVEELADYDSSAFLNTTSKFYSCRTAIDDEDGNNFAAAWSDLTNGETTAMLGRVDFAYTSHSEGKDTGRIEKEIIRYFRNWDLIGIDYLTIKADFGIMEYQIPLINSEYHGRGHLQIGSIDYPIPLEREDAEWVTYIDGAEVQN